MKTDLGAIVVFISVSDKNGIFDNIAHGCRSLEGYLKGVPYFGETIRPYGNRIGDATFTLDGAMCHLVKTMVEMHFTVV